MSTFRSPFYMKAFLLVSCGCMALTATASPAPQSAPQSATANGAASAAAAGKVAQASPQSSTTSKNQHHRQGFKIKPEQAGDGQLLVGDFDVSGDGFDVKARVDGSSPPFQVMVTNTSDDQTVNVTGVSATAPYSATTNCTAVAPGQTCEISVTFSTTTVCEELGVGSVTLADDDPGGPLVFDLDGWGADSNIQVKDLTDANLTPSALAQALVGSGVQISNVKYTGAARAAGQFTSSSNILGFSNGIVLSSGSARNVPGPNCEDGMSVDNGQPGDADLDTIVGEGNTTNDAAVLEFDFVPTSSVVSFQYVFASEEYNDFVFDFNDVFGFFLTDNATGAKTNIALIPGTTLPVSINNVNDGNPLGTNPVNPQFYINNEFIFPTVAPVDTEENGLTKVFTAQATVVPNGSYHIKLAVADANDFALDSNVFLQAGSLTSSTITLDPSSLAFGNQAVGSTSDPQTITVANVGPQTVTIVSIATGTNFSQTNNCPATLSAVGTDGSTCTVTVSFAPTATGALTGNLTVTFNGGTGANQTEVAALTGTGTASGSTVTIAPTSLTFTSQAVGTTSPAQNVVVTNMGTATVTFTSIATTGDFAGANLSGCATLAAAAKCTFAITFTPTASGTRTGAITFTDNATGSPQSVGLTGTATGGGSTVTVTPTSLTFAQQALNTTSAPQSVTVKNTGTTTVNFTNIAASGDFAVADGTTCSTDGGIAAGASCTVAVTFTPTANGARTGTLAIANSATGSPQSVALTGSGGNSSVIITVPSGGSTTATTTPGGTAFYGLIISGAPGVTGTVQLTCASSSPLITCTVIPSTITLNGGTTEVAFGIQTFCQGTTTVTGFVPGGFGGIGLLLGMLMMGGMSVIFSRNRRMTAAFAVVVMFAALGVGSCASLPKGTAGATPAGTYFISLSTTLNGQTQTLPNFLTLVVK